VEYPRIALKRAQVLAPSDLERVPRSIWVLIRFPAMRRERLVAIEAIAVYCLNSGGQN